MSKHPCKKIWLSDPHMSGSEQKYVQRAFETNWIAPLGPNVNGFEKALTSFTGAKAASVFKFRNGGHSPGANLAGDKARGRSNCIFLYLFCQCKPNNLSGGCSCSYR